MLRVKNSFFHQLVFSVIFCVFFIGGSAEFQAQIIPGTGTEAEAEETQEVQFPEDSLNRRTPRGTVVGLINSVSNQNYSRATRYLNLPESQLDTEGEGLVRKFQNLMDRGGRMLPYSLLSTEYDGKTDDELPPEIDRVGTITTSGENIDIYVEKITDPDGAPIWLFSRSTLQSVASIETEAPSLVERLLPNVLKNNLWRGAPAGHWIAAIFLAVIAYWLSSLLIILLIFLIRKFWYKAREETVSGIIDALSLPLKIYLGILVYVEFSREAGISISVRLLFGNIIVIIAIIAFLIFLWRIIDFLGTFSKRKLSEKGNVAGVSAILFFRRAAKVAIVIIGIIIILGTVGIDVTAGIAAWELGDLRWPWELKKQLKTWLAVLLLLPINL